MPLDASTAEIEDKLLDICQNLGRPEKGYSDRLCYLNKFYLWMMGRDYFEKQNPCTYVPRMKVPKHIRPEMNYEDIIKLMNCPRLPKSPLQDHITYSLMIKCYCAMGCRCSDLIKARLDDLYIGQDRASVIFRHTKSGNDVRIYIPKKLAHDVVKNAKRHKFKEYLFENRYGRRISSDAIQGAIKRRLIYLGIINEHSTINFGTHNLRHSKGTRMDEMHIDATVIQRALYHEDIQSTMRYIHVSDNRVHEANLQDPIFAMLDR